MMTIRTPRRGLITGLISLVAAPAVVRAASIMPVKMPVSTTVPSWRDQVAAIFDRLESIGNPRLARNVALIAGMVVDDKIALDVNDPDPRIMALSRAIRDQDRLIEEKLERQNPGYRSHGLEPDYASIQLREARE